jgi:crotonobetainyl-CoA:carnitine CoA-transferase CaiB-like acyl-CoA transferase
MPAMLDRGRAPTSGFGLHSGTGSFRAVAPTGTITRMMALRGGTPRVVELPSPWTRFAGRLLVGLGYEVVLVEPPSGDPARAELEGLAFAHWHAGKRSVVVDVTTAAGKERLRRLIADADVLLDSSEGAAPTEFVAANPRLVHVRVSPFGSSGPHRGWQATDLVIAATGGMLSQVGRPDEPPLSLPQSQAEQLGGVNGALAALLGLRARERTGAGQYVDVSAQECVAASLEAGALVYLHEDRVAPRPGDTHPLVPHRLFRAADGYLAGGLGGSPRMWQPLVEWMTESAAQGDLDDPSWGEPSTRMQGQEHVFDVIQRFAASHPKSSFAEEAQKRRLPWAAVDRPDDMAVNPQLAARGFFVDVEWAGGRHQDLGLPFPPAAGAPEVLAVPALGADDDLPGVRSSPRPAATGGSHRDRGALEGMRIVDLTWVLAGPYATRTLADHGAEVIKIESASRPDPTRFAPFMHLSRDDDLDPDTSGYFNNVNRNKRSVTLNLRDPRGLDVLRQLISTCDVVIENFSAGVMSRMGLGYQDLCRLRSDIIYVSMSGMGHTGPWRDWVCYADTVSAAAGLTGLTGWNSSDVVGVIYGHGDILAGHHAALAVLDALQHRDATGEGRHVDLSQMEAVAAHMGTSLLEWTATGRCVEPLGNAHPEWAPHGVYPCLGVDRWCAIAVRTDAEWRALAELVGGPQLAADRRFGTAAQRRRAGAELDAVVSAWTSKLPAALVAERLQQRGVPAGPVQDGRDLVENDGHLRDRGFYVDVEHPVAGRFLHEGVPVRLADTPGGVRTPAPLLGGDTDRVLIDELGYTEQRIHDLRAEGVLS